MRPTTQMSWLASGATCGSDIQKQSSEAFTTEWVVRLQEATTLSGPTIFSTERSLVKRLKVFVTRALINIKEFAL